MSADWENYENRRRRRYGSTDEFRLWIRENREDLDVPEDEMVLACGKTGWTPADEAEVPPGEVCPFCRGIRDPESKIVCPKCLGSGADPKLAAQRDLAEEMERDRDEEVRLAQEAETAEWIEELKKEVTSGDIVWLLEDVDDHPTPTPDSDTVQAETEE